MAQHVYAKGRLSHSDLSATEVQARLQQRFPTYAIGSSGSDFTIKLQQVEITGFIGVTSEVEFTVAVIPISGTTHPNAVASTMMIIDGTETFLPGVSKALECKSLKVFKRKTSLEICEIKSSSQHNPLLYRENESPLRSTGARTAYVEALLFILAAIALVVWQLRVEQPHGDLVQNLLGILLALPLAAVGILTPIYINYREWKSQTPWKYAKVSP